MADVCVPQQNGEIRVSLNGDPPQVYRVRDGRVVVDDIEVPRFVALVPGAAVVTEQPSAASANAGNTGKGG